MKNVFKGVLFVFVLLLSAAFVSAGTDAPALTAIADQTVNEGALLQISLVSTAPDVGPFTNFSVCTATAATDTLCSAAPSKTSISIGGLTVANITNLSNTAGQFNWSPSFAQAGTYFFLFNASDADSNSTKVMKVTVNDQPPKITSTSPVVLGGTAQERSNPNHDDEDRRQVNTSEQPITIKNEGSEALNNIKVSHSLASGFTDGDVMLNYTLSKTTLAVGESMVVNVKSRVPQKLDAVDAALKEGPVKIATLSFTATSASTSTAVSSSSDVQLRAENNLEIKDVKVKFDGSTESVDDGDTVEDMKPGQVVQIEVEVENRFKDKEDVTIEDVELSIVSSGDIDIDEDEDFGDLGPEENEAITVTTVLDDKADDNTYDVEITVEGVDEFGAKHGEKWIVKFEIKRENHEISLVRATLTPSSLPCEGGESTLGVDVKNTGRRDEEDVYVRASSEDLKFSKISDRLNLDRDDADSVSWAVPVANGTKPGNYRIVVDTYYNTNTKSETTAAILTVAECAPVPVVEEPKVEEKPPAVVQPPVTVIEVPKEQQPKTNITASKKPFVETPQYLALLALGYIVVLGGGAAILMRLLRKP